MKSIFIFYFFLFSFKTQDEEKGPVEKPKYSSCDMEKLLPFKVFTSYKVKYGQTPLMCPKVKNNCCSIDA